jgi:hypothetical protein
MSHCLRQVARSCGFQIERRASFTKFAVARRWLFFALRNALFTEYRPNADIGRKAIAFALHLLYCW